MNHCCSSGAVVETAKNGRPTPVASNPSSHGIGFESPGGAPCPAVASGSTRIGASKATVDNVQSNVAAIASANGLKGAIYGVIIVLFVLFEPLGLYGRWLKIKLFFQLFPLYKRATFKRQKIYVKSERNR